MKRFFEDPVLEIVAFGESEIMTKDPSIGDGDMDFDFDDLE